MAGRRTMKVFAKPVFLKFNEMDGYVLVVKINRGPDSMLDRPVTVQLTAEQIHKISEWKDGDARLELEDVK